MKAGRNDPCPCGSGAKFKHCCGAPLETRFAAARPDPQQIAALVGLVEQGHLAEAEAQAQVLVRTQPAAGIFWKILSVALLRQEKDALPALHQAAELLPRHLGYLRQQSEAGRYLAAGPVLDEGEFAGVLLIRASSLANAQALVQADPAVEAGRLTVQVVPVLLPSLDGVRAAY